MRSLRAEACTGCFDEEHAFLEFYFNHFSSTPPSEKAPKATLPQVVPNLGWAEGEAPGAANHGAGGAPVIGCWVPSLDLFVFVSGCASLSLPVEKNIKEPKSDQSAERNW